MSDVLFGFLMMLFIYVLGAWSGIFVMALINAGKDRDDLDEELRETDDKDELP